MAAYAFEDVVLPEGFLLPRSYLELLTMEPLPYFEPWWFLTEFPDNARYWLARFKREYPDRVLIPFAKFGMDEDIACFDGTDLSGDPVVHYVHAGASPGWEDRGSVPNFDSWLQRAKKESEEWLAEDDEDSA